MAQSTPKFQRMLVKLSGEALMGRYEFGIDPQLIENLSQQLESLRAAGVQLGVVIGGGNIFRGAGLAQSGVDRVRGDHMGMLATVMNCLALKDGLDKRGVAAEVMSALDMPQVCHSYQQHQARDWLQQNVITLFAAGTGNPYFTTDTAASLRAIEIEADLLVKATKVDGVYDADPVKNPNAKKYDQLSFDEAIAQRLGVMDATAMVLCRENNMKLAVCNINEENALMNLAFGQSVGTLVHNA